MTFVCPHCFGDSGLRRRIEEIRPEFPNEKCSFHPRYKGVPIEVVAEIVDTVFRSQFGIGDFGYDGEQRGEQLEQVVGELAQAEYEQAQALSQALIDNDDAWPPDGEEPFYEDLQNYVRIEHYSSYHSELWQSFCESIMHDQRFFNSEAKNLIADIFAGVEQQRDHERRSPVYRIDPGTPEATFYRARIADNFSKRKEIADAPEKTLAPPPKRLRRAGRMNPAGVVCFYGAYEMDTCIAELRPRVGSVVIGAKFSLQRPIYVLDTTRFEAPIKSTSPFSKNHLERMEQWIFMESFRHEIAKPISPNDEHIDYIPTQAVAEYLMNHHEFKRSGTTEKIEGIIYKSAQRLEGKNIALLGEAAHVVSPDRPTSSRRKSSSFADFFPETFGSFLERRAEGENPALRVEPESVEMRKVAGARFDSETFFDYRTDDEHDF